MKKKKETVKEVWFSISTIQYCECPYCKKTIIMLDKRDKAGLGAMKKWKKIPLKKKIKNK